MEHAYVHMPQHPRATRRRRQQHERNYAQGERQNRVLTTSLKCLSGVRGREGGALAGLLCIATGVV